MAVIIPKDRVKDTSTTTGTGSLSLSGTAPTGYQSFNTAFGTGVYFNYVIEGGSEWETGIGHLSASTTLVRDTILSSSNSNSAVSFSAGTKNVFVTVPAGSIPQVAMVQSDVTYNNTTTFANISDLTLDVIAGAKYLVEAFFVTDVVAQYIKADFNGGSATATTFNGVWLVGGTSASAYNVTSLSTSALTTLSNTSTGGGHFMGHLTVNAGGTLIMRGAQNSLAASDSILRAGSMLRLTRVY